MEKKPGKGDYLAVLLRSEKTVFTTKDIALLWGERLENAERVRLNNYVRQGKLMRVCRGIYAKDGQYDRFELATRLYTPSYISFETVLTRAGINFQYYGNVFVASYMTRELTVDGQRLTFVRMRRDILSNMNGIEHLNGYSIATKERAFLDRIFVGTDYYFDHLDVLDWDKVFAILPIYRSARLEKKVNAYFEHYRKNV